MSCRTESAGRLLYRFCPEDAPPVADRVRALVQARFFDELTGRGLTGGIRVWSETPGLLGRVADDGIGGLVGNPARRFPGLAANGVDIALRVTASRYLERAFSATLGPFSTGLGHPADYPHHFAPVDLGDVAMHRAATRLLGRVIQAAAVPRTPVAGATIEIDEFWHRFPAAHEDPLLLIEPGEILSIRPGLYQPRANGVDSIRRRLLVPVPGEEKRLRAAVRAGDRRLPLSDRLNLVAGSILAIDAGHPDLSEYIEVDAVTGASSADQPAVATLIHPVAYAHRQGTAAVRVVAQPPGAANGLRRDAIPGDRTLFLTGIADIANPGIQVEISGAAGASEYQTASPYAVQTGPEGDFVLPALSRISQLWIQASGGGLAQPLRRLLSPDYGLPENRFDLIST